MPLLISTVHRLPQRLLSLFPASCIFDNHSLAVASNSGNSSASCAHVITVQQISCNWILVNCQLNCSTIFLSLPCRARLDCQPSSNWGPRLAASSHQPHSLLFTGWLSTDNSVVYKVTPWHRPHWKHHCSVVVHLFVSVGMCLLSHCLETSCTTPLFYYYRPYLATATVYRVTT
jgi:hypothetical protein